MVGHTIYHVDVRISLKEVDNSRKCSWVVNVIRIEPADDIAIGRADPFVDRIALAAIRLRYPTDAMAKTGKNSGRLVAAPAVEHHMLQSGHLLIGYAA
ncbi:hypothetical protein RHOFW104T7_08420 [Rhodanobacter thiooxydans]|uniref:Uncharacterized protein n=1 Tax=Rhodanobacter thiooxydans TaxID=416169 RepID=A0A154QK22_9GAMM|nr:hypothetical protein RHOFW104T7_08420 [Rhodanobacter thiooxydans]